MIVCVVAMIVGKQMGYGQDEPKTKSDAPAAATSKSVKPAAKSESKPTTTAPAPNPYTPDPDESTSLALAQDEAIIAQQAWNTASLKLPEYQQFNTKVNDIYDWCRKVISKHKWDKDGDGKPTGVTCNINVKPVEFGKPAAQMTGQAAAK
jgi:hypothetical protein